METVSDVVQERIVWLQSIGVSLREIRRLYLDREMDDLTFTVLVNELLRARNGTHLSA